MIPKYASSIKSQIKDSYHDNKNYTITNIWRYHIRIFECLVKHFIIHMFFLCKIQNKKLLHYDEFRISCSGILIYIFKKKLFFKCRFILFIYLFFDVLWLSNCGLWDGKRIVWCGMIDYSESCWHANYYPGI